MDDKQHGYMNEVQKFQYMTHNQGQFMGHPDDPGEDEDFEGDDGDQGSLKSV